jgi:sarcosine oxidase subunit gamma
MSKEASALQENPNAVSVTQHQAQGMISLRGDLSSAKLKSALKSVTDAGVPARGRISLSKTGGVAWMSPDELLILTPYAKTPATVAKLTKALGTEHALVVDVSDARAVFRLKGAGWRDVLGKLTPADLSSDVFTKGQIRRTRIAQVAAAFWMVDKDTADLVCFRSVATYVSDLLALSAKDGAEVGFHTPHA